MRTEKSDAYYQINLLFFFFSFSFLPRFVFQSSKALIQKLNCSLSHKPATYAHIEGSQNLHTRLNSHQHETFSCINSGRFFP